mmetsp:Transcript_52654/g.126301  ORF Transcript_52654/g.126301 Transcript_52654/m.126301 type:complete len:204 (-) Transcript_52654:223-834(-)
MSHCRRSASRSERRSVSASASMQRRWCSLVRQVARSLSRHRSLGSRSTSKWRSWARARSGRSVPETCWQSVRSRRRSESAWCCASVSSHSSRTASECERLACVSGGSARASSRRSDGVAQLLAWSVSFQHVQRRRGTPGDGWRTHSEARTCSMVGRWRVAEWSMESSSVCSAGGKKSTLGGASSTAGPGLAWCGALPPAARWR